MVDWRGDAEVRRQRDAPTLRESTLDALCYLFVPISGEEAIQIFTLIESDNSSSHHRNITFLDINICSLS